MTLGEAKENLESNVETVFVRLNKAERNNRRLTECLEQVHGLLTTNGARGLLNAKYRIENCLEGK